LGLRNVVKSVGEKERRERREKTPHVVWLLVLCVWVFAGKKEEFKRRRKHFFWISEAAS
jgi:hypothetical protein